MMYQVPVLGRYTAISALPSPSKSPVTGLSVAAPHEVMVAVEVELFRMNHSPVDGLNTASSAFPSLSKSPGTRTSVAAPQLIPDIPSLEAAIYHVPSIGRNTDRSVLPSPSKSARDLT